MVNLLYAGAPAAGRRSSLEALRAEVGARPDGNLDGRRWGCAAPIVVGLHDGSRIRWPWPGEGQDHRAAPAEARAFLHGLDAVVFVVDPRRSRFDANDRALAGLSADLERADRPADSIPLVFQLNKLDLPLDAAGANMFGLLAGEQLPAPQLVRAPIAVLRQRLRWPRCACVETIASDGIGVGAAIEAALRLAAVRGA